MLLIMLQLLLRKFPEKDFFRPRQKLVSGQIDKQSDDDDKSNGMKIKQIRFYGESFQTKKFLRSHFIAAISSDEFPRQLSIRFMGLSEGNRSVKTGLRHR